MDHTTKPLKRRLVAMAVIGALALHGAASALDLRDFRSPPKVARPRVWWHWMNGDISKEGIQADLEWMQRTGIGGFQNFDAAMQMKQVVGQRLPYMSPAWKDAFHYAITLADKMGLEAAIAGSPGWSESGGPWVKPEQGMKKIVWSETVVEGGAPFAGKLPKPPANAGPIQDAPLSDLLAAKTDRHDEFYADTVVLAFPVPAAEVQPLVPREAVTNGGERVDAGLLGDGRIAQAIALPKTPEGGTSWLRYDYGQPVTVRSLVIARTSRGLAENFGPPLPGPDIECSDDGVAWKPVVSVPADGALRHTLSFAPVTARYFRAVWRPLPPMPSFLPPDMLAELGMPAVESASEYQFSELRFESGVRVHRAEEKAGFATLPDFTALDTPTAPGDAVVTKDGVIDLTGKLRADGSLDWTPPAGRWTVLRMGYSLTGIHNHPASAEGTGLEVDKLSARHVRDYMTHYLDMYKDATGGLMGKRGLQYVINDSWEAHSANWTDDMLQEFQRRRGYDARPWLPALTGRVVGSAADSDRFLWDWRRTLADLVTENHYGEITRLLRERGMGHYSESHEMGRAFIADGMDVKRGVSIPMSAMWTQMPGSNGDDPSANADVRESASVAHIYGQNLVAAESLTAAGGAWRWSPASLKSTADKELAMGVNRFVLHTSVHQPSLDKMPGISLGPFGQWFTRNETWAGAGAKAWVDYLARSSWMLQQGRFVADVAWFYGEDSNITALYGRKGPPVPDGYNFDYVNPDVLTRRFKVVDGQLATATGMRYRVLALDPRAEKMSLPVLKALRDLVAAGAIVVGPRPTGTPSLADDAQAFDALVRDLWGTTEGDGRRYGKGRIYASGMLEQALRDAGVEPDFSYTKPAPDTQLLAVHRKLRDGDIYFVNSRNDKAQVVEASLRAGGRVPELWRAETGRSEPVAWRAERGRTVVSLQLAPGDAFFIVLRQPTRATSGVLSPTTSTKVAALDGKWKVGFQPGRHAPDSAELPLGSWADSDVEGIKYFAGTGTYRRTIDVPASWLADHAQLWLNLGEVHEMAEVTVNGKNLGVVWRPPYRVNVGQALHAGSNTLEIAVTDTWANRLIHDARPDARDGFTFITPRLYRGTEPLMPAGLVGPVDIERTTLAK